MSNEDVCVGLDIGTDKVCAIVGRYNQYQKIEILGHSTAKIKGVKQGEINNPLQASEAISRVIREVASIANVEHITYIYTNSSGKNLSCHTTEHTITCNNTDQLITEADVSKMIDEVKKFPIKDGLVVIDVIPQEFIVDSESVVSPVGMWATHMIGKFLVITTKKQVINNLMKAIQIASPNTQIAGIIPSIVASMEAVLTEDQREMGTVVMDIGGGVTDIGFVKNGIIKHIGVFPWGGHIIDKDLSENLEIVMEVSKKCKERFGSAVVYSDLEDSIINLPEYMGRGERKISLANLATVIGARVEEYLEIIHYLLNVPHFFKGMNGILLVGGSSNLNNIVPLTNFKLQRRTEKGSPSICLATENKYTKEVSQAQFSTAIGLLIRGIKDIEKYKLEEKATQKVEPKSKKWNPFSSILVRITGQSTKNNEEDNPNDDFDR